MDMSAYRDLFISEAREHLKALNETTLLLEAAPAEREHIDALFRHSHSLKGMSASMGFNRMAELAHRMEDLMDRVRKQVFPFGPGCADLLLEGADLLTAMVDDVARGAEENRDTDGLIDRLNSWQGEPAPLPQPDDAGTPLPSEEGPAPEVGADAVPPPPHPEDPAPSGQTVRIRSDLLDHLVTVTGELVTVKHRLATIAGESGSAELSVGIGELSRLLHELQGLVMQSRMMPFGGITEPFHRVVRDLARKGGKKIALEIVGREIELDRAVLEEMGEPLIHLIRNAVDHGIEVTAVRDAVGKPDVGTIRLVAVREKESVVISVEDDGAGMEPARLIAAALKQRVIKPEDAAALSTTEAFMLTCIPGFSTATQITEVSGRGVGMDAVNALIRSFGGSLAIESTPGKGSRILLTIPRSIAIVQVLLVICGPFTVGIPLSRIRHLREVTVASLNAADGRPVVRDEEGDIPLYDLYDIFGLSERALEGTPLPAVVTEVRGRSVAILADRFVGQQDVFIRPLGRPLASARGLSGAAVLGDGSTLFILDVNNLV